MKIVKHSTSAFPTQATGAIVGMDKGSTLEITNAFPYPTSEQLSVDHQIDDKSMVVTAASAPRTKANIAYQNEMINKLREVNVDANSVGWYTSANMGNFINATFIENQYMFQKQANEHTVALVHDVSRSAQGAMSLRAFRLSTTFMAAFAEGSAKFITEKYDPLDNSRKAVY